MLWKVQETDVFLLGTVHVADRPLPISARVEEALHAVDTFAFEAIPGVNVDKKLTHFKTNDALSLHIPADLFEDVRQAWRGRDLPDEELERLKPASVVFRISAFDCDSRGFKRDLGIECGLHRRARDERKKEYFLESVNDGFVPYVNAPSSELERFLWQAVHAPEAGLQDTAALVNAWASDDIKAIAEVGARAHALMPTCYSAAIGGRNQTWLPKIDRFLRARKKVVIIVGALHMVGSQNLPSLLNGLGYECTWIGNGQ